MKPNYRLMALILIILLVMLPAISALAKPIAGHVFLSNGSAANNATVRVYVNNSLVTAANPCLTIPSVTSGSDGSYATNLNNLKRNDETSDCSGFWATGDPIWAVVVGSTVTPPQGNGNGTNITISSGTGLQFINNVTLASGPDITPPLIDLFSPVDGFNSTDGDVVFSYNVTDNSSIANCSLLFNGTIDTTDTSVTVGQLQNFTKTNLTSAIYNWSINCTDIANNQNSSEFRILNVSKVGQIAFTLLSPTSDSNVSHNQLFNFSVQITCLDGSCGDVNASLDPIQPVEQVAQPQSVWQSILNFVSNLFSGEGITGLASGSLVPTSPTTPFYTTTSNPANISDFGCLANMVEGSRCNITWFVNATGDIGTSAIFFAYFNSTDFANVSNTTTTLNLTITDQTNPLVFAVVPAANTSFNVSTVIEIAANVTDNINVSSVLANVSFPNGTSQILPLALAVGDKYNTSFTVPLLTGQFNITFIANDTSNNINNTVTTFFLVPADVQAPLFFNITESPIDPANYSQGQYYEFNITWTDNLGVDTVFIRFNGTNFTQEIYQNGTRYSFNRTDLATGTYAYTWFANDSDNNQNSTTQSYTIQSINSSLNLTLNGTSANITINVNTTINLSVTRLAGEGNVQLINAGTVINQGAPSISNLTTFSTGGVFNITGLYERTRNFTASSQTFFVTVQDNAPIITLISPANNTLDTDGDVVFSYNVTDETAIANCSLLYDGVINVTDTSISKGVDQNFTKTNLTSDIYNWSISCTDSTNNRNFSEARILNVSKIGQLTSNLITPTGNLNASHNEFFEFSIQIICLDGSCGDVNASLDPISNQISQEKFDPWSLFIKFLNGFLPGDLITGYAAGALVPTTPTTPFWTNVSNPANISDFTCLANMAEGSRCNVTWYVNASGDIGTSSIFFAFFNSTDFASVSNTTETLNITITDQTSPQVFAVVPMANSSFNTSQTIEIAANVTDNINVSAALVNISFPNGTSQILPLTLAVGDKYNTSFTIPVLAGQYNLTFIANDTSNNINNTVTTFFLVTGADTTFPQFSGLTERPSDPTTYSQGQFYEFNITWTDNVALGTVFIRFNGTNFTQEIYQRGNVFSFNRTDLAAGIFNYTWFANDTSSNLNFTVTSYTVSKAASSVNVLLNGTNGNRTESIGATLNLSATRTAGEIDIKLIQDGTVINTGAPSISNVTTFNNLGTFNITAIHENSSNFTFSSDTHFVNIEDQTPEVTLISPAASQTNTSSTAINVTFICNATDDFELHNISLFITDNANTNFALNQTSFVNGTQNQSSFNLTLALGTYTWNCRAIDNASLSAFATANRTLTISAPSTAVEAAAPTGGGGGGVGIRPTCEPSIVCTDWTPEICEQGEEQQRVCTETLSDCSTTNTSETRICPEVCTPDWSCADWDPLICPIEGLQTRECVDLNDCGTERDKPLIEQECIYAATCDDGIQNQGETGVDCGGEVCPTCPAPFFAPVIAPGVCGAVPFVFTLLILAILITVSPYAYKKYAKHQKFKSMIGSSLTRWAFLGANAIFGGTALAYTQLQGQCFGTCDIGMSPILATLMGLMSLYMLGHDYQINKVFKGVGKLAKLKPTKALKPKVPQSQFAKYLSSVAKWKKLLGGYSIASTVIGATLLAIYFTNLCLFGSVVHAFLHLFGTFAAMSVLNYALFELPWTALLPATNYYYKLFKVMMRRYEHGGRTTRSIVWFGVGYLRQVLLGSYVPMGTKVEYDPKNFLAKVKQLHGRTKTVHVPVYKSLKLSNHIKDPVCRKYLQTLLGTSDDMETIVRVLEFISGKDRTEIVLVTKGLSQRPKTTKRSFYMDMSKGKFRISDSPPKRKKRWKR